MSTRHVDHAARIEDLTWMAETGETVAGAAHRLGFSADALNSWCRDHGRRDLYRRLTANSDLRPVGKVQR
ncbi:MAG: hypothetical protein ACR2JO_07955 [Mycobacteriales bacterium]